MYDENMVAPMRAELTEEGVRELNSQKAVDDFMDEVKKKEAKAVLFFNSVCGCAAGTARPAFIASLRDLDKAILLATTFAGVDKEATDCARGYLEGVAPSSPSIAFFRGGDLVYFVDRLTIEGSDADILTDYLGSIYKKFFGSSIDHDLPITSPQEMLEVSVEEVKQWKNQGNRSVVFYDCRDISEHEQGALENSELMTNELAKQIIEQAQSLKDATMVFFSNDGQRSLQAVSFFRKYGLKGCLSLRGGYNAWKNAN